MQSKRKISFIFGLATACGLTIMILVFQNCGSQFKAQQSFNADSAPLNAMCTLPAGTTLASGEFIEGYTIGSALYPVTCGQKLRRTCLENGSFDHANSVFSDCTQYCLHPDNAQPSQAGFTYVSYSKSNGTSLADCEGAKVSSVCNPTTGVFVPAPPSTRFSNCLVPGQTCAYSANSGAATPSGNSADATVTGYTMPSATFPTTCGTQVTRTCQASGQWTGSVPVYTACLQRCQHPDTNQPVDANYKYVYYSRANGTSAECIAARTESTCQQSNGSFSPTVATNRHVDCVVNTNGGADLPYPIDIRQTTTPPAGSVPVRLTVFRSGLNTPWGMTFLPDGRLLVTQKSGALVIVSSDGQTVSAALTGVPVVDSAGQGGLLDVALDPQFAANRRIYLSYAEREGGSNGTAVARGVLNANATGLENVSVIFRQEKKSGSNNHYGSRLVFRGDGTLFITTGERFSYSQDAQNLSSNLGKVIRLNIDGTPASGNPFLAQGGVPATVWSLGHRNIQAATLHPTTGDLWVSEHGPQGGDEVNLALAGRNFGWPQVSYGCSYGDPVGTNCRYGGGVHATPMVPPLVYWFPTSTAPGGMAFYTGSRIPEWQGNLFVGGLGRTLWRFILDGNRIVTHEALFVGQHDVRDVRMGPDGYLYIISRSSNQILRIEKQ